MMMLLIDALFSSNSTSSKRHRQNTGTVRLLTALIALCLLLSCTSAAPIGQRKTIFKPFSKRSVQKHILPLEPISRHHGSAAVRRRRIHPRRSSPSEPHFFLASLYALVVSYAESIPQPITVSSFIHSPYQPRRANVYVASSKKP